MSLRSELDDNWLALIALCEDDFRQREDALNDHSRNSMTIRGFAITAVAALVAASYASGNKVPAYVGAGVALYFGYIDLRYSLLYAKTAQGVDVLRELSKTHRKLLSRRGGRRLQEQLNEFKGDLRSYATEPAPKEARLWARVRAKARELEARKRLRAWLGGTQRLAKLRNKLRVGGWRQRNEGLRSFRQFIPVYLLLAGFSLFTGIAVDRHQGTIVLCRPAGEVGAMTSRLASEGCDLKPYPAAGGMPAPVDASSGDEKEAGPDAPAP